ncbi:hypothetical protein N7510_001282 [Penicillium lagena]|uniref:uncharacterized protein n=1 Tax=Penicillium lagena TaxID=94218 RepID=UPI002540D1D3|nr:uncharacterized protein N7510_001282 [Penicillium lagena]KAJ5624973.1 hypothetical protein N7510_001282 [Penicillium lagena]
MALLFSTSPLAFTGILSQFRSSLAPFRASLYQSSTSKRINTDTPLARVPADLYSPSTSRPWHNYTCATLRKVLRLWYGLGKVNRNWKLPRRDKAVRLSAEDCFPEACLWYE